MEPTIAVTPADFTFSVTGPLPAGDTTVLVYATNTAAPMDREPLTVSMDLLIPVITALPDRVELLIDETADSMLVQVNNAVAGPLEWTHTDPASPWRVTPAGAGALWVVFDPGGLGASFWEDTIWISDPLAANSPLALPLSADVEGVPPAPPFLVVAPAEVFWSARVGAATADSAFVLVSANLDTAIVWQINTWPSWLYVESNSGVTASVLTLRAARDYQPLGVYHDTLEIWSPDASNSPLKLPVTLTVDIRSAIAEEPVGVAASKPVAYLNPFNSSVLIEFGDASSGPQDYLVLDLIGRTVDQIRLVRTGTGEGVVRWSPNPGRPSGVYFIRGADDSRALPVRVLFLK